MKHYEKINQAINTGNTEDLVRLLLTPPSRNIEETIDAIERIVDEVVKPPIPTETILEMDNLRPPRRTWLTEEENEGRYGN